MADIILEAESAIATYPAKRQVSSNPGSDVNMTDALSTTAA